MCAYLDENKGQTRDKQETYERQTNEELITSGRRVSSGEAKGSIDKSCIGVK